MYYFIWYSVWGIKENRMVVINAHVRVLLKLYLPIKRLKQNTDSSAKSDLNPSFHLCFTEVFRSTRWCNTMQNEKQDSSYCVCTGKRLAYNLVFAAFSHFKFIYSVGVPKKNNPKLLLYPRISKSFYWETIFLVSKEVEQDAENWVICLSLHSESVAAAHTGHTSLTVLIRTGMRMRSFIIVTCHMYQQHDPHNFKCMLVCSFAMKTNTKAYTILYLKDNPLVASFSVQYFIAWKTPEMLLGLPWTFKNSYISYRIEVIAISTYILKPNKTRKLIYKQFVCDYTKEGSLCTGPASYTSPCYSSLSGLLSSGSLIWSNAALGFLSAAHAVPALLKQNFSPHGMRSD